MPNLVRISINNGFKVKYHIDTDNVVTKNVRKNKDCLLYAPDIPPRMDGFTIYGWRLDNEASSEILDEYICYDEGIELYAVLKKDITITYDGNTSTSGETEDQTGTVYYNNGNILAANVTLNDCGYYKTNYVSVAWAKDGIAGEQYIPCSNAELSNDTTFYAIWDSPSSLTKTYGYTGEIKQYIVRTSGVYQFEVYGAQGSDGTGYYGGRYYGGRGGYSYGRARLKANQPLYVVVGGVGTEFNGGGSTGGDATHIGKTNNKLKYTAVSDLYIVAGGGGAGSSEHHVETGEEITWNGGSGGGYNGAAGQNKDGYPAVSGGSQTGGGVGPSNGSYGQGGGGGGGGYYGGGGASWRCAGSGGSGYIGGVSNAGTANGYRAGNGYASVSFISY